MIACRGVRELWVIDAVKLAVRVFRAPTSDGYRDVSDAGAADRLLPQFAPQAFALSLDELELN